MSGPAVKYEIAQRAVKVIWGHDPNYGPSLWSFDHAGELLAALEEAGIIIVLDDDAEPSVSARCPLCGRAGQHAHSGMEQTCYRNGVKRGQSVRTPITPIS